MTTATAGVVEDLHRRMVRIRHFEENCAVARARRSPALEAIYLPGQATIAAEVRAMLGR